MGVGAAMIFPSTLSLLANVFTGRAERARAIGLWGATTGIGIATGPITGGFLLAHFWWGSVFVALAPIALAIAVLVVVSVPASRDPSAPPIDLPGLGLSTLGMGTLVLGLIEAPSHGWTSAVTIATIAAGLALLGLFAVVEARTARPMLDVSLFRNPRFTAASGSVSVAFFALTGFTFLITQYFQFVQGYSPLGAGVRLLPVAFSVAAASIAGTKLAVRIGNKAVVGTGLALFAAALAWASTADASTSYLEIAMQMIGLGFGMGFTSAPATEAIMGAVPTEKAGIGSAVNDATRLFGGTLGVAVIGSVAASLYADRLDGALPPGLPPPIVEAAHGSIGGALAASEHLPPDAAHRLADAASAAFVHSLSGGVLVASAIAAAGSLLAFTLLPARPREVPANVAAPPVASDLPDHGPLA
jgi:predicted MFS family arabinose efflux permease